MILLTCCIQRTNKTERLKYREQTDSHQKGGSGEMGEKGKGLRHRWVVTKQSQGCKAQGR